MSSEQMEKAINSKETQSSGLLNITMDATQFRDIPVRASIDSTSFKDVQLRATLLN